MTIRDVLRQASARLEAAGVLNADYDAAVMLGHVMDEDALMLRMNSWKEMPQDKLEGYEAIIARNDVGSQPRLCLYLYTSPELIP